MYQGKMEQTSSAQASKGALGVPSSKQGLKKGTKLVTHIRVHGTRAGPSPWPVLDPRPRPEHSWEHSTAASEMPLCHPHRGDEDLCPGSPEY